MIVFSYENVASKNLKVSALVLTHTQRADIHSSLCIVVGLLGHIISQSCQDRFKFSSSNPLELVGM